MKISEREKCIRERMQKAWGVMNEIMRDNGIKSEIRINWDLYHGKVDLYEIPLNRDTWLIIRKLPGLTFGVFIRNFEVRYLLSLGFFTRIQDAKIRSQKFLESCENVLLPK